MPLAVQLSVMARSGIESRIPRMELFVGALVAGGISLVGGLWLVDRFGFGTPIWILGTVLIAAGVAGLGFGLWSEIEL
jgi:hypothetical protein